MNEERHWNKIAPAYEDEIFDVFRSDKNRRLPYYFLKHADARHRAIDFGCGTGKAFQYLSPSFREIIAVDISAKLIDQAKKKPHRNITFKRADLSAKSVKLPPVEFVFCCNVIMLPDLEKNRMMFQNIRRCLADDGNALIVIPSMESIMHTSWRLIDWYRREGTRVPQIPTSEFEYYKASKVDILQGIIHIDRVPTKHYSEPELRVLLEDCGLSITALEKLEYDWTTEFPEPPEWMKAPYPWDWLVECRRK